MYKLNLCMIFGQRERHFNDLHHLLQMQRSKFELVSIKYGRLVCLSNSVLVCSDVANHCSKLHWRSRTMAAYFPGCRPEIWDYKFVCHAPYLYAHTEEGASQQPPMHFLIFRFLLIKLCLVLLMMSAWTCSWSCSYNTMLPFPLAKFDETM